MLQSLDDVVIKQVAGSDSVEVILSHVFPATDPLSSGSDYLPPEVAAAQPWSALSDMYVEACVYVEVKGGCHSNC